MNIIKIRIHHTNERKQERNMYIQRNTDIIVCSCANQKEDALRFEHLTL